MADSQRTTSKTRWIALLAAACIGAFSGCQFWLNATMEGYRIALSDVLGRHVLSWLSWGLAAPYLWRLAEVWALRDRAWRGSLLRHGATSLAIALVHRPLHVWFAWYPFWGAGEPWEFVRDYSFFSLYTDVAIYWSLIGAKTVLDQRDLLRARELRTTRLAAELTEAKLSLLEQQLQPHFLFNTLHALQVLQHEGRTREATLLVEKLSELLRGVLDKEAPSEIPLRDELALCEPYLDLMGLRFGDRFTLERDLATDALDGNVPRLMLQPLLENAFTHGVEGRREACRIVLRARVEGASLVIEVENTGPEPGGSGHRGAGIGLANVEARLASRFGERAGFELLPAEGGGALARLRLPYTVEVGEWVEAP